MATMAANTHPSLWQILDLLLHYTGIRAMLSTLYLLSNRACKKFGANRLGNDKMTSVPLSAEMDTPASTTANAFDLLHDGEDWENASINTADQSFVAAMDCPPRR